MLILVTGGARSGKSRHAEALVADSPQVLYLATSQIVDDEMAQRIQHHRDGRPGRSASLSHGLRFAPQPLAVLHHVRGHDQMPGPNI